MLAVVVTGLFAIAGLILKAFIDAGSARNRERAALRGDLELLAAIPESFGSRESFARRVDRRLEAYAAEPKADRKSRREYAAIRLATAASAVVSVGVGIAALVSGAGEGGTSWAEEATVTTPALVVMATLVGGSAGAVAALMRSRRVREALVASVGAERLRYLNEQIGRPLDER